MLTVGLRHAAPRAATGDAPDSRDRRAPEPREGRQPARPAERASANSIALPASTDTAHGRASAGFADLRREQREQRHAAERRDAAAIGRNPTGVATGEVPATYRASCPTR